MTLENGGCCCNGGCNKPDFSQLEPVLDEYAKIPGSLDHNLAEGAGYLWIFVNGCN